MQSSINFKLEKLFMKNLTKSGFLVHPYENVSFSSDNTSSKIFFVKKMAIGFSSTFEKSCV